ncbi:hypothetical protein [Herbiconiux solani]|uniref:hypothetical protein n=1 Tax=Herbiconiux solani TaxID=661329 RepID=UPI0008240CD6|nr:hypothetical protein [Herbiconiux solani]
MTPEQADFAARFASYEIVTLVDRCEFEPLELDDGRYFHSGGVVRILPSHMRIEVIATNGAEAKLFEQMLRAAENFRDGKSWAGCLTFTTQGSAGDEWYESERIGRFLPTAEPNSMFLVVPCDDTRCTERWHEYDEKTALGTPIVIHNGDSIDHPQGHYTVTMIRVTAEGWRLEIEVPRYELTVFSARSLANDINWLSIECEKLNSTEAVAA